MCNNNSETIEYKTIDDNSNKLTSKVGLPDNFVDINAEVNNYTLNWFGEFTSDKNIYTFDGVIIETDKQNNKKLYIVLFNNIKYNNVTIDNTNIKTTVDKNCKIKNILIACHCNTNNKHNELFIYSIGFDESLYKNNSKTNVEYIDPDAGCGTWDALKNNNYDIIWCLECPSTSIIINYEANKNFEYQDFNDLITKGYDKLTSGGIIIIPYYKRSILDDDAESEIGNYKKFLKSRKNELFDVKLIKNKAIPFYIKKEKNILSEYLMILTSKKKN